MNKVILFAILLFFSLNSFAKPAELDKIVAVVNDDIITKSELNHAVSMYKMQLTSAHGTQNIEKQVLDQLINKKLQLQIAKQAGVKITDDDVNHAIEGVAKQNNISVPVLFQRLKQEGMSMNDYRDEIRDQMLLHKLQQQEVINRISITQQEVAQFSQSKTWQSNENKEFLIEDILVPVSDTPSSDEVTATKTRAQNITAKLKQGVSLRDIALAEKNVKQTLQSEELEWRRLPEIPSLFADQIAHLHPKEIAGPIQAGNGFHILILKGVRAAASEEASLDKKQIEELLMQRKFEEALQHWVSKLRSQAYIVTNA